MYNEKVLDHFRNPRNAGIIEDASIIGEIGDPACGDMVKIYLKINSRGIISDIKFQTFGCAAAIACSSMITELALGKHIDEAEKLTKYDVAESLGGLPPGKMHCSNLGADGLQMAIREYKTQHNIPVSKNMIDQIKESNNLEHEKFNDGKYICDRFLDLKGKECPMTFVYTKVMIESMEDGQILKILLDFPPAFLNVPKSVEAQQIGYILEEEEENGVKIIWIRVKKK